MRVSRTVISREPHVLDVASTESNVAVRAIASLAAQQEQAITRHERTIAQQAEELRRKDDMIAQLVHARRVSSKCFSRRQHAGNAERIRASASVMCYGIVLMARA